jgi:predicted O-linked N-acetylglucosamine transferase (SPINDLY family)
MLASHIQAANRAIAADDLSAALPHLRAALQLAPTHAGLIRTAARVHANASARALLAGLPPRALELAQFALQLEPDLLDALINAAGACHALDQAQLAADYYQRAFAIAPDAPNLRAFTIQAALKAADTELGENAYAAAGARLKHYARQDLRAWLKQLSLPMVYQNQSALTQSRTRYQDLLMALADAPKATRLQDLAHVNFRLAYQGLDDTALQARYGQWLCAQSAQFNPALAPLVPGRVALVSSFFRECTVGSYFASWLDALQRAGIAVEVYQIGPTRDHCTEAYFAKAAYAQFLDGNIDQLAQTIAARGVELIIYPELGMDARTFALASLRLARVQACAWGHPVSSGLPSIDYYFSVANMEPVAAHAHYSEQLLLLPGIGTRYQQPAPPPPCTRAQLGLPERAVLALAGQSAFKLLPANDQRMVDFAHAVPNGHFVLFEGMSAGVTQALQSRLREVFASAELDPARLHFLPMGSRTRFLQVNAVCDVMVDSVGFSGGNTSIDALLMGLPIWTAPGEFMRARQSDAMLKILADAGLGTRGSANLSEAIALMQSLRRNETHETDMRSLLDVHSVEPAIVQAVQRILATA